MGKPWFVVPIILVVAPAVLIAHTIQIGIVPPTDWIAIVAIATRVVVIGIVIGIVVAIVVPVVLILIVAPVVLAALIVAPTLRVLIEISPTPPRRNRIITVSGPSRVDALSIGCLYLLAVDSETTVAYFSSLSSTTTFFSN